MEEWKRVVIDGIEYNYEVSTKGNVRNMKTGRIMAQVEKTHGYLYVSLWRNNVGRHFSVHRLVATMFIPNPDNLPEVDHINRDRKDNRVENLRWLSHKKNRENGGKRVKCVETGQEWDTITQASEETGCDLTSIVNCCAGRQKTTGGFHWEYVD